MFKFDPTKYGEVLSNSGHIYIQDGCDEQFMNKLQNLTKTIKSEDGPENFSFIPTGEDQNELFKTFRVLCGVEEMTISRHHILHYRKDMPSYPHKDRKSLQYSCAIGIENTKHSSLFLWPDAPLDENSGSHWRDYVDSKGGQGIIDKEIQATEPVKISTEPGDLVFFPTSRMYHHRSNTEGIIIYYIAVNEFGIYDRTASRQERKNPGEMTPPPVDLIK